MEQRRQVFSVDLLERYAAKGRGDITCMAAGNDVIVLGTSKGWVIRHDFGVGDSFDIDLSAGRPGEQSIHRVFVDPGGSHCIATVVGNGTSDTFYTHAKWTKPRVLSKLKASTREVILGTDNGQLHEIAVDEKDKKEKYIKFLFELSELPESFTGLQMETASINNGTRYYVMAVTPHPVFILLQELALRSSPNGDENFVENKALLDYSKLGEGASVVNRISEQIVEELYFDQTPDAVSRGVIGLCSDASAGLFYAYDQSSIFQVSVNDEGRDMWKVYLDLKEYAAALANCRDALQRDQVYLVQDIMMQAEDAFNTKDFLRAASFYAKDALRTFLLRKLDNLAKDDKCQITMISTWATELYLDKMNRLLLEDDTGSENSSLDYQSIIKEFRAFLSDSKDVLDEATTIKLLESYGRVDELVFFASLKEQHEIVVHHYIQLGEAKKALLVLQKPNVPIDLQYKFAPDLIMLDAYETVESWMTRKDLNPRKLIPAMMRYSSELHAK
ncbi:zinc ion binding [Abeliophyllum distichum]|uniref:Zinc ion binding n=1 Tax=Abeliophyllum distichum TaxID=126358 RepID=A0ABD1URF2_9LAMI